MSTQMQIKGGVYLVIDPAMQNSLLLSKLTRALEAGIEAVQLWNHWPDAMDKLACIAAVSRHCKAYKVPLLIDNDWELLLRSPDLDGVHFDAIPDGYKEIKKAIGRPIVTGVTCSGNLDVVRWAATNGLNYVSFCAMFPSSSAGTCDIVMPETVMQARGLTQLPLFVSGGITPENMISLRAIAPFDGVAVISGIMNANDPYSNVKLYQEALSRSKSNL